jgi:hypothetical protein
MHVMAQRVPHDPSLPDPQDIDAFHRQSLTERFLEGPRLFDLACRIALDGIRHDFPRATEAERWQILRERVEQLRISEGDVDE